MATQQTRVNESEEAVAASTSTAKSGEVPNGQLPSGDPVPPGPREEEELP